jgi:hypothetical protein
MTGQTNAGSAVTVTRRPQPGAPVGMAVAVLAVGDPNRTRRRSGIRGGGENRLRRYSEPRPLNPLGVFPLAGCRGELGADRVHEALPVHHLCLHGGAQGKPYGPRWAMTEPGSPASQSRRISPARRRTALRQAAVTPARADKPPQAKLHGAARHTDGIGHDATAGRLLRRNALWSGSKHSEAHRCSP